MKYCELTTSEKAELRETLFAESIVCDESRDFNSLSEESKAIVNNCECAEDIPEEVMEEAYGEYDFMVEDFWCNL